MKRRVVITGIGPATSIGIGRKGFFDSINCMNTNIVAIPENFQKNYKFRSKYKAPMPQFSLSDIGIPKAIEDKMEDTSRLSVLCSYLAIKDAGFEVIDDGKYFKALGLESCSTIIGVGIGGLQSAFNSYMAHIKAKNESDSPKHRFNRMIIPMVMPNSAAAWPSIIFGLEGKSFTLNASCASGTMAIGEAYTGIKNRQYDVALAGGVEALGEENGAIMRGFDMIGALTTSEDGLPRPFSKRRTGFLFNDGAGCMLVLESLENAIKRGAEIYGEIVQYECNSDAYNIVQIESSGESISRLFKRLPDNIDIDYINAHGTGTVPNDEIEEKVINQCFGNKEIQPLINSTKGIIGHSIGASGALEAAVAAMSIKNSIIHGNLIDEPLESLNLPLKTIEAKVNYAVSASYGFGGHNALLLLKRYCS